MGLIGLVGVAFVMQTSALGTSGYQVHALEKQVTELSGDIQKLNSSVADAQSMVSIQKRLKDFDMVAASDVKYLNIAPETAVTKR